MLFGEKYENWRIGLLVHEMPLVHHGGDLT